MLTDSLQCKRHPTYTTQPRPPASHWPKRNHKHSITNKDPHRQEFFVRFKGPAESELVPALRRPEGKGGDPTYVTNTIRQPHSKEVCGRSMSSCPIRIRTSLRALDLLTASSTPISMSCECAPIGRLSACKEAVICEARGWFFTFSVAETLVA